MTNQIPKPGWLPNLALIVGTLIPFVTLNAYVTQLTIDKAMNELRVEMARTYAAKNEVIDRGAYEQKGAQLGERLNSVERRLQEVESRVREQERER